MTYESVSQGEIRHIEISGEESASVTAVCTKTGRIGTGRTRREALDALYEGDAKESGNG